MHRKISPGDNAPQFDLPNIHGQSVTVPDSNGRLIHLQFRRFAGCPVCNLHLQSFIARYAEIQEAGVKEIVIFHSNEAELLPYQGRFPFDVIGDPAKVLYRLYGVESSLWAVLNPAAWPASIRGNLRKDKPALKGIPEGGILGLPADILVAPEGHVKASRYGRHAYDQWSVDEMLNVALGR